MSERPAERTPASDALPVIGWREWIGLPDLGIPWIKAKIDTGARSCALHAFDVEADRAKPGDEISFHIHPVQRDADRTLACKARLTSFRAVKDSGGRTTQRPTIETAAKIAGHEVPIELTLIARDEMGFRMLVGRRAVSGRFLIDPGRSFVSGVPETMQRRPPKRGRRRREDDL